MDMRTATLGLMKLWNSN